MIEPKDTLKSVTSSGIEPYAQPCLMKLNANENYLGPSPRVMKKLEKISIKEVSNYPFYGKLTEILADLHKVSQNQILLTGGVDEAMRAITDTYLTRENTVISAAPTSKMPQIYTTVAGAEFRKVFYKEKWRFPQEEFLQAIDEKVKIILFTTPNNPTGDIIPAEFIEKTAMRHPEKLVVIDESFAMYAGFSHVVLCKKYENIAVVRSFSKDYGLAGLRIGYIVTNSENIANIKKVLCPYPVGSAAVIAAEEAVCDKKYIDFLKNENTRAKEYLKNELSRIGGVVYPSYTNFLLVDFNERAGEIYEKLARQGIFVKKYENGMLKNHLRITVPSLNAAKRLVSVLSPENLFIFDLDGVVSDRSGISGKNESNEELLISLKMLRGLDGEKALYSERSRQETEDFIKKFNLQNVFSCIISNDDLPDGCKKPDIQGLNIIIRKFFAKKTYFLGDTADDMKCAKNAGIYGIGVLAPDDKSDGQKDFLYVCGAKYVINHVNELPDALKKLNQEQNY